MPDTTDNGLPYPLASDPFSIGNEDIQDLAEAVDPYLELPFMRWCYTSATPGTAVADSTEVNLAGASGSGYEYEKSSHFSAFGPFTYTGPDWWFEVAASVELTNGSNTGVRRITIYRGSTAIARVNVPAPSSTGQHAAVSVATAVKLTSGDTISAKVFQNSGASEDIYGPSAFSLMPVRPA